MTNTESTNDIPARTGVTATVPSLSAAADLDAAVQDLAHAQHRLAVADADQRRAVAAVLDLVRRMRLEVDTPRDRRLLPVLRHLYWQLPGIPSGDLAKIAGFPSPGEMTIALGSVPSGLACGGCGHDIPRTSRSWKPPPDPLCTACSHQHRRHASHLHLAREQYVDQAPVTAASSDWLVAARLVMAYPPITTGVDEEDDRDGLWYAYDLAQDLDQKLADGSSATFAVPAHKASCLVGTADQAAGWDAARTCALVGSLTDEPATVVLLRLAAGIDRARDIRRADVMRRFPDGYQPTPDEMYGDTSWP